MSKSVILPYDPTWQALECAKVHCRSYITNQGPVSQGQYKKIVYFFDDERDATIFALRWA